MSEFYVNSKGHDVLIADMAYPHLASAYAKLVREQQDGPRQAEINALAAELDRRDAERAEDDARAVEDMDMPGGFN